DGQTNDEFALIPSRTETHKLQSLPKIFKTKKTWLSEQLPPVIKLHIQRPPRAREYNLNISASDSQKKSFVNLHVVFEDEQRNNMLEFSQPEYFANFSKLLDIDEEIVPQTTLIAEVNEQAPPKLQRGRVMYELVDSDFSDYFLLDHRTAQLTIRRKLDDQIPSTFALTIKAFLENDPSVEASTLLSLTDISDTRLAYFSKCFYDVTIPENAYADTFVLNLQTHGSIKGITLINGSDHFTVDRTGEINVRSPLDREEYDQYVFLAKIISDDLPSNPDSRVCTVATIKVKVEDVNDHSPWFERKSYVFYTDELPYNNTEIGTLRAFDEDRGIYGQLHFRILDEDGSLPFTLYESNNAVTLYFSSKKDQWPEKIYSFAVEAYDSSDNPRTSRVTVQVNLHPRPEGVTDDEYDIEESLASHVASMARRPVAAASASTEEQIDGPLEEVENDAVPRVQQLSPTIVTPARPSVTTHKPAVVKGVKKAPKFIIRPLSKFNDDLKDNVDKFETESYKFMLYGSLQQNQYVGTIRVNPGDGDIRYELEAGIRGFFNIDPKQGHLTVAKRLLEDEYEEVRFSALAKRNGKIVANTLITVILDDSLSIYEQTPRFEQSLYRFEIVENAAQSVLGTVQAHHRAVELNNDDVIYALQPNADIDSFNVDSRTGVVSTRVAFDREQKHLYTLEVSGCLTSNMSSCGVTTLAVVVLDENDNPPKFEEDSYKITISNDIESGTEITTVKAVDPDSGKNGQVRYELSTEKKNFKIDADSGEIRFIGDAKTFEADQDIDLRVRAVDHGEPPLDSEAVIVVTVQNQNPNPNAPEFVKFRYELTLPEKVPAGTSLLIVEATDADEGPEGHILYRFGGDDTRRGRIQQLFDIDPETGEIRSRQPLTPETEGPLIQFVVEAHDQSVVFPRKAETVVMLRFKEQHRARIEFVPLPKTVFISSEKAVGSDIIGVSAKATNENDQHSIRYRVRQPEGVDQFVIDELGGSLKVKNRLQQGRFPITIMCYLVGTRINATHHINVVVMTDRDKYPVFEKLGYEMEVPTSAAFPVKLSPLNATLSTGHIEYSIYQPERLPKGISVDKVTGQLTIFEDFLNNVDGSGNAFVVIRARNIDFPTFYSDVGVNVVLTDDSESFAFPEKLYRLVIAENKIQGTTLDPPIEVIGGKELEGVRYHVEPADSLFAINTHGELYTKKNVDLEELPNSTGGIVQLTVVAEYQGEKATTKVQIKIEDDNEFSPVFLEDQYDVEIRHQPVGGEILGKVKAIDEDFTDRNNLRYSIIERSGAAADLVEIMQNGSIVMKHGTSFSNGISEMIVQASDLVGHSTEVVVSFYVRIEDNETITTHAPTMQHVNDKWTIGNSVVGSKFVVHGLPNARWQFAIAEGNDDGVFELREINDTMAEVEIIQQPSLSSPSRNLEVEMMNIENPDETVIDTIAVDLTTPLEMRKPHFVESPADDLIELPADFNPNSVVFTVRAAQEEGSDPISYDIIDNPQNLFEIDSKTGVVTFANNGIAKLPGEYRMVIRALATNAKTKMQFETNKEFTVKILTIEETTSLATSAVTHVPSPTEPSTPHVATPTEKPTPSSKASMRPTTPTITEVPTTSQETLSSTIAEIEAEPLEFDQRHYAFAIDNAQPGSKIGEIYIRGNSAAPLLVEITPRTMEAFFHVDADTGEVSLNEIPEASAELQEFSFNVTFVDSADPERRATTEVSVALNPFNVDSHEMDVTPTAEVTGENQFGESTEASTETTERLEEVTPTRLAPSTTTGDSDETVKPHLTDDDVRFSVTKFTAVLPEGRYGKGGSMVALKPHALNHKMPKGVKYHIDTATMIDGAFPFTIREDTGELIVFSELDREDVKSYEFVVTATYLDGDEEYSDSALVEVRVLDVNDNAPKFVHPHHVVSIPDNAPVGIVVTQIEATDPDEAEYGQVHFSLDGNDKDYFAIDESGTVTLQTEIPSDVERLQVSVIATDGGRPALRNTLDLTVEVFSSALSQPLFRESEIPAQMPGNSEQGDYVAQAVAGTGNYKYAFENSFSDLFVVDNTGMITLGRSPLKEERNKYYSLLLTATDDNGEAASTVVNVFLANPPAVETTTGVPVTTTTTPQTPSSAEVDCTFSNKVYNAEIKENTEGRHLLAKVGTVCENLPQDSHVVYFIHQGSDDFELNEVTGELFVVRPLDRENRTLNFIVVNVTIVTPDSPDGGVRRLRQSAPIVEYARSKLASNQALVVVRVIDENDNAPKFTRLNGRGEYVFVIDAQSSLKPIGRVEATDADEKNTLKYSFTQPSEYFSINPDTGVVNLTNVLPQDDATVHDLEVQATDGTHVTSTRFKVFPLVSGYNTVILTANNPVEDIDDLAVSRDLTQAMEMDTRVLNKYVYIDDERKIHPEKSHVHVYALKKETHEPLAAEELQSAIVAVMPQLQNSQALNIAGVSLPTVSHQLTLTNSEIILIAVCIILALASCVVCFLLLRCCKRRSEIAKADGDYMVDVESTGPRPYNVELISRKTAQNVLAGRELPNPFEENKLSPALNTDHPVPPALPTSAPPSSNGIHESP
uniref:Cadherin n=1 Tax=Panagrellus redivivus TaxID=6233 RepID=A0A7E4ZZJ3_PANRE